MNQLSTTQKDEHPKTALTHASTVESQRAMAEIQAAMTVAHQKPRDENKAYERIMTSCRRVSLAEHAVYSYPRGGTKVEGPSIRLAEVLAQCWGNIDFGIKEVDRRLGESVCIAYAWDLETNTRQVKEFVVPHVRDTKQGQRVLTDTRDIYEMTANMGARRLRACILGIIPGDVVDAAVAECSKTLAGGSDEPIQDRVRKMVDAFSQRGVTPGMIEQRLGHKLDSMSEHELADLRKVFVSLKDGMSEVTQWFEHPKEPADPDMAGKSRAEQAAAKYGADPEPQTDPPEAETKPPEDNGEAPPESKTPPKSKAKKGGKKGQQSLLDEDDRTISKRLLDRIAEATSDKDLMVITDEASEWCGQGKISTEEYEQIVEAANKRQSEI